MHIGPSLRGVPLTDAVIRAWRAGETLLPDVRPVLGAERPPVVPWLGKRPIPPSLARWLEHDQGWLEALGEAPVRLAALVDRAFGTGAGDPFRELQRELLPEPCALLPGRGESSARFLYLGATDVHGEYAVLAADIAEPANVRLWSPGFDTWLAEEAGLIEVDRLEGQGLEELPEWRLAMTRAAQRVLGGRMTVPVDDDDTPVDREVWDTLPGLDVD